MEEIFSYICAHAEYAGMVLFGLLLLSGFNVPISEDLIIITGGALVTTCIPHHYFQIYLWVFAGSWLSAWEAYWIGRLFGPKLYNIRWFNWAINPGRIAKLHHYYEKFGAFTFIVGRFFPGGIRNGLFMTAGMGKMPFLVFIIRDGIAAVISTNFFFYLGHLFAKNYHLIVHYFVKYDRIALGCIIVIAILFILYVWMIRKKNSNDVNRPDDPS